MSSPIDAVAALLRLENLEAYILALEQGPEAGLAQLRGRQDPDTIRRQILILSDNERFDQVADLVRGRPPHVRWADLAIHALVRCGDVQAARSILDWSRS